MLTLSDYCRTIQIDSSRLDFSEKKLTPPRPLRLRLYMAMMQVSVSGAPSMPSSDILRMTQCTGRNRLAIVNARLASAKADRIRRQPARHVLMRIEEAAGKQGGYGGSQAQLQG